MSSRYHPHLFSCSLRVSTACSIYCITACSTESRKGFERLSLTAYPLTDHLAPLLTCAGTVWLLPRHPLGDHLPQALFVALGQGIVHGDLADVLQLPDAPGRLVPLPHVRNPHEAA